MTNECDNDPGEEFPAELAALEALAQRLDQARYSGPAWREPRPRLWAAVLKPVAAMAAAAAVMLAVAYLSLLIVHREPIPPVAVRLLPSPAPSPIAAPPATLDVSLAASETSKIGRAHV